MKVIIITTATSSMAGVAALAFMAFLGYSTLFMLGFAIDLSGAREIASFGDFMHFVNAFLTHFLPFTFGTTFDEYLIAEMLIGGMFVYVFLVTISAAVVSEKYSPQVFAVATIAFTAYPVINLFTEGPPSHTHFIERGLIIIFGTILYVAMMIIPALVGGAAFGLTYAAKKTIIK